MSDPREIATEMAARIRQAVEWAERGERSYKRKGVEDIADWIESGEWRR